MTETNIAALPIPPFAAAFAKPEDVGAPKSILIYGKPGTFKSSIAGGAIKLPQFKKMLYIDIDNGSEVLMNEPETAAAVRDGRIQILPINKLDPNAFLLVDQAIEAVCNTNYGYDVVGFDTLNVAQEVAAAYFLANTYNEQGKLDSRKAWGEVAKWTLNKMWALHNARHFTAIVVTHLQTYTEDDGAFMLMPKLQGSARDSIAAIPSVVAMLEFHKHPETGATHLVALLGQSTTAVSKNRFKLPLAMIDFDLPSLYSTIEASRNAPLESAFVEPAILKTAPIPAEAAPAAVVPESTDTAAVAA